MKIKNITFLVFLTLFGSNVLLHANHGPVMVCPEKKIEIPLAGLSPEHIAFYQTQCFMEPNYKIGVLMPAGVKIISTDNVGIQLATMRAEGVNSLSPQY